MAISNDSIQEVLSRIHSLQNLIIDYHFDKDPWYRTWAPYLIALGAGLLTLYGQYLIFKLNRRKEIHIKVAELYGKYKSLAANYSMVYFDYNKARVRLKLQELILKSFNDRIADEEEISQSSPEEIKELYDAQRRITKNIADTKQDYDSQFSLLKTTKLELNEYLHQIHFYFKDKNLETLIQDLHKIKLHSLKIEKLTDEMATDAFFVAYIKERVVPQVDNINKVSYQITTRILSLS